MTLDGKNNAGAKELQKFTKCKAKTAANFTPGPCPASCEVSDAAAEYKDDQGAKYTTMAAQTTVAKWTKDQPKKPEAKKDEKKDADKKDDADASGPQPGACGDEEKCDTKDDNDKEIKCGAAKLGAGLLASLAIAASL